MWLGRASLGTVNLILSGLQHQIPEIDIVSHRLINERRVRRPNWNVPKPHKTGICPGSRNRYDWSHRISYIVKCSRFKPASYNRNISDDCVL